MTMMIIQKSDSHYNNGIADILDSIVHCLLNCIHDVYHVCQVRYDSFYIQHIIILIFDVFHHCGICLFYPSPKAEGQKSLDGCCLDPRVTWSHLREV